MKNRGLEDVLMFCVDGLTGLKEAILAAYPKSEIQRCIIHLLRNSFKYVSYKDIKEFARDFKEVYKAVNEEVAIENLAELEEKWAKNILMQLEVGKQIGMYYRHFSSILMRLEPLCKLQI